MGYQRTPEMEDCFPVARLVICSPQAETLSEGAAATEIAIPIRNLYCVSLTGDHDGGARTAQLGQVAVSGHADLESRTLSANDRTVIVGSVERTLQASSAGASPVARF